MSKRWPVVLLIGLMTVALLLTGCSNSKQQTKATLKFADAGWDSIKFHNAVAMFIIRSSMDYGVEEVSGASTLTYQALKTGDLDIYMEVWSDNFMTYKADRDAGSFKELGINFDDNTQGLYVPRYVISGDAARNIKPLAPDLKMVTDLFKYKDVFADQEQPGKGRIYGSIPGWVADQILHKKYQNYDLAKAFTYFQPGSDAALAAAISSAYEKGVPIVAYYWEPTWLTGKYDLVRLQDTPYNPETLSSGIGDFPSVPVTVCVSKQMQDKAPDAVEFLAKYKTSSEITSKALAYMINSQASYEETAKWFLRQNEALWTQWVTAEQADKVRAALK